jgi:hypothetical protein
VACRFAKARQRKTVVYMLGAGDPTANRPDIPMTKRTAEQLVNALGDHRFDDLDLIVQSSGGDIHAAYLIMSTLRERMNKGRGKLIACVPSRAQSAATLLCLGADKILLGELGALGPLDAQIRMGVTDAGTPNYISALHLLKALSRLQEFSLESFSAMAGHLDAHQASHDDQVKYGIKYSHAITRPLFEHIQSGEVGYWDQMLKTGEEYGRRLLERGDLVMEDIEINRTDHIKAIVHQMVFEYPSPGLPTWSEIWCDVENSKSFRSSRDRRIFPGRRLKGASALHNYLASIFTAPSVTTWSDISGDTRKNRVTRLVTLRYRSTMSGALVTRTRHRSRRA